MRNILLIVVLSCFIGACTTPVTPQGPRVSASAAVKTPTPAISNALPQGLPLNESLDANTGISFPNPSGTPELIESTNVNNFPQNSQPEGSIATNIAPKNDNISYPTYSDNSINAQPINSQAANIPEPQKAGTAVQTLIKDANNAVAAGQLDKAASSLERAVRIEPNNAGIWYDLAQIRLHQNRYAETENLAKKSIGLAGEGSSLAKRNYKLIAASRNAQGDSSGAMDAESKSR